MKKELWFGDCLELEKNIESGSVDLILTDLPYGNMKGAGLDGWNKEKTDWDLAIDPKRVFEIADRILRKNGKMVLFSQEPYTARLINEAIPNIPFSYRMVWEKDHFANSLIAKKAPVNYYEDILVFSKNHDMEGIHPLRPYFKLVMDLIGLSKKHIVEKIGQKADHTFRTDSSQYSLCTEKTYQELIEAFEINKMEGFKDFSELQEINAKFNAKFNSIFNLWEGKKFKSNILKYKRDYQGLHPTQKPILLIEDLIKTFSNEGNLIVDLTAGSGTTAEGCENTSRQYICIEKDPEYYQVMCERVRKTKAA